MNLRAYITLCEVNVTRNHAALLGILDDNLGLRGRIFRDLPILGPLEVLEDEAMFNRLRPTQIIVTTPTIGEKRLSDIRNFCRARGIKLTRCSITEEPIAL
jgi:FlaA1/EpsC-like NDP-sugar epimerase